MTEQPGSRLLRWWRRLDAYLTRMYGEVGPTEPTIPESDPIDDWYASEQDERPWRDYGGEG